MAAACMKDDDDISDVDENDPDLLVSREGTEEEGAVVVGNGVLWDGHGSRGCA